MKLDTVVCMDALEFLRTVPDSSVHCVVTSPPYFGLRSYLDDGDPAKADEIGLEDTPAAYVARLVAVFEEVRRVLRDDGCAWINLGDSYANDGKWGGSSGGKHVTALHGDTGIGRGKKSTGLKPKDLIGIPWRCAFALQEAGWWLRSDIPWIKRNPMPGSQQDRPTTAHEYVFMLSKSARYWWDIDAIRQEPTATPKAPQQEYGIGKSWSSHTNDLDKGNIKDQHGLRLTHPLGRAPRTTDWYFAALDAEIAYLQAVRESGGVWSDADEILALDITTKGSPLPHFAMFPQALIEPMILAGCPAQVCSECGAGYVRLVERKANYTQRQDRGQPNGKPPQVDSSGWQPATVIDNGFAPSCTCHAPTDAGICLDPFMGTGTTGIVAQKHGRHWLGCDVNAETVEIANTRTRYHGDDKRMMAEQDAGVQQLGLFGE